MNLRIAVLGLLSETPGSGYDLLQHFAKSLADIWPATQSQLYGELSKLADLGLIASAAVGPRGRKEYHITEAGRTELQRWVTHPEEDPPFRSPKLLRILLLGALPPEQARDHMAAVSDNADASANRFRELRDTVDWHAEDHMFFSLDPPIGSRSEVDFDCVP